MFVVEGGFLVHAASPVLKLVPWIDQEIYGVEFTIMGEEMQHGTGLENRSPETGP
jgi:hypothetical protein